MTVRRYKRQREPLPNSVNFIVSFVWKEINRQKLSSEDVALRSGVSSNALRKWRDGTNGPTLVGIQNVLYVLGYKLTITERTDETENQNTETR